MHANHIKTNSVVYFGFFLSTQVLKFEFSPKPNSSLSLVKFHNKTVNVSELLEHFAKNYDVTQFFVVVCDCSKMLILVRTCVHNFS